MKTATTTGETTVEAMRAEYRTIRARSHEEDPKAFDAAVRAAVGADATPADYVRAARTVRFLCRRCSGTGVWAKAWTWDEAGRPVPAPYQKTGVCYRCEGRGSQDDRDARRNFGADIAAINDAA